jgi:hypothetical protein
MLKIAFGIGIKLAMSEVPQLGHLSEDELNQYINDRAPEQFRLNDEEYKRMLDNYGKLFTVPAALGGGLAGGAAGALLGGLAGKGIGRAVDANDETSTLLGASLGGLAGASLGGYGMYRLAKPLSDKPVYFRTKPLI